MKIYKYDTSDLKGNILRNFSIILFTNINLFVRTNSKHDEKPVICLSKNLYDKISESYLFHYNLTPTEEIGYMFGYKIYLDEELELNEYIIEYEKVLNIIRRKNKIKKILKTNE